MCEGLMEAIQLYPTLPPGATVKETWPPRKTTLTEGGEGEMCDLINFPADLMIAVDASFDVSADDFAAMKEAMATVIDQSLDVSPDVVRVGFVAFRYITVFIAVAVCSSDGVWVRTHPFI